MPIAESTTLIGERAAWNGRTQAPDELALAIAWSRNEPERIGELLFANGPATEPLGFGRACPDGLRPLELVRQRPGAIETTGQPRSRTISRHQWTIHRVGRSMEVANVGQRVLRVNGAVVETATLRPGDLVEIGDEMLLCAVQRPPKLAPSPLPVELVPEFGLADAFGIVGESVAAWELRRQLAFVAGRGGHVLLTGASGTGKELAARAIHGLSSRSREKMLARNAATFPEGLVDAELFGNLRDYPNPGMPERPGIIGAADGSTLFLDEIGELPQALQAHLLRVLESGEYQRLGETRSRTVDLRVVAATNREPDELKHDVLARLRLRVSVPGLDERREDIPLIARHLLRKMGEHDPLVAERCFEGGDPAREPRWTSRFVAGLLQAHYRTHVRELETWLWQAILDASDGTLDDVPITCTASRDIADEEREPGIDPKSLDAEQVRAALAEHGGSRERAWRALGLRSRHQLLRLMRRFGL